MPSTPDDLDQPAGLNAPQTPRAPAVDPDVVTFYLTQAGYIGIDIEGMAPSDRVAPACRARPIDVLIKDMLINEMFALNEVSIRRRAVAVPGMTARRLRLAAP